MSSSPAAEASALPSDGPVEQAETSPLPAQQSSSTESREAEPSPADAKSSPRPASSHSEGEYSGADTPEQHGSETADKTAGDTQPPLPNEPLPAHDDGAPPLPNEPLPSDPNAPPLPAEPIPEPEDDGWDFHWNANDQSYWFYNRFTGAWQKENPRVPAAAPATTTTTSTSTPSSASVPTPANGTTTTTTTLSNPTSIAGGYNPAIHGSYDENAWYAQNLHPPAPTTTTTLLPTEQSDDYTTAAFFNRHTGQWQTAEQGAERHSDEAKSRRQMRAFFDVDAAANMHDGRSLKAERAGIKPSKAELKAFKEKRRAKKEEKRRAWLRD